MNKRAASQSKTHSLIEALVNVAVGYCIAVAAQIIVFPDLWRSYQPAPKYRNRNYYDRRFDCSLVHAVRRVFNQWHGAAPGRADERHRPAPTLFAGVVADLAARGVQLSARPGEYVVNLRDGTEATAYITDDLADAIEHGHALARSIAADPQPTAGRPAQGKRRRRPLRMTPKAVNKRRRLAQACEGCARGQFDKRKKNK